MNQLITILKRAWRWFLGKPLTDEEWWDSQW
jgi:hypothetical protein